MPCAGSMTRAARLAVWRPGGGAACPALAANTAHAVHGAIGVTEEYDLQLYTRRLHGWRLAHGSEAYWHQVVGAALMGSGDGAVQFVRGL
ncbi:acyl-CoA dehydrogenase [Bordetella pertussis]|nr:acyl-CoA dehydrogenase [Bordetella pertussis]